MEGGGERGWVSDRRVPLPRRTTAERIAATARDGGNGPAVTESAWAPDGECCVCPDAAAGINRGRRGPVQSLATAVRDTGVEW